ncbi:hypothetical protein Ddc_01365 [Ditylenchus destructor]|nr:hypothetical protein Ddc_01365 [Ditylenchus destructor]
MVTMRSLTTELKQVYREFDEIFGRVELKDAEKQAERFLAVCNGYSNTVDKVHMADRIFSMFTFVMIAIWLPTTIFAPVAFLHTEWSIYLIFRMYDVFRTIFHLFGLCIIPAQIYSEHQQIIILINCQVTKRIGMEDKLTSLMKTFGKSIVHTNVCITVGGMVIIRKSMILTCLSMIVPYVVLFLQLHIGTPKY